MHLLSVGVIRRWQQEEKAVQVKTIGLDIAKMVFQVHGMDTEGAVAIRKRLPRSQVRRFF